MVEKNESSLTLWYYLVFPSRPNLSRHKRCNKQHQPDDANAYKKCFQNENDDLIIINVIFSHSFDQFVRRDHHDDTRMV